MQFSKKDKSKFKLLGILFFLLISFILLIFISILLIKERNLKDELLIEIAAISSFLVILFIFIFIIINSKANNIIKLYKLKIKLREKELLDSKENLIQYTNIIEKSNIISKTDLCGNIIYVSDSFCEITGYKREELLGANHSIIRHPDVSDFYFKTLWNMIKNKKAFCGVIKNLSKEKSVLYFKTTINTIFDKEGEAIEYIATSFDMTQEFKLKESLRQQNFELIQTKNSLIKSQHIAKLGNSVLNIKTGEMFWSDELYNIFEKDINTFKPNLENFKEFFLDEEFRYLTEYKIDNSIEDKEQIYMYKINVSSGIKYIQATSMISEFNKNGKALFISSVLQDISNLIVNQKKLLEKEKLLSLQSKMATMGEMIENITHQLNQPLNVINLSFSSLYLSKVFDTLTEKEFEDTLKNVNNAVSYLSNTIENFKNFFEEEKESKKFNLEHSFKRVFTIVGSELKNYDIKVIKDIDYIDINSYENNLVQVFINIINNAKDELIKKDKKDKKLIFIKTFKEEDKFIFLIKDNAGGIPNDYIHKIFESHFTTKEKINGTGIGLYMSKQIIEKMNANIEVTNVEYEYENILYKGAEFKIILLLRDITC